MNGGNNITEIYDDDELIEKQINGVEQNLDVNKEVSGPGTNSNPEFGKEENNNDIIHQDTSGLCPYDVLRGDRGPCQSVSG